MVAVFGATGYTGRLVAHALRRHRVPLLLAGRNAGKLAALAEQLGGAETLVASVGDRTSLDALARRAGVLVNCVGPFLDLGEPVVRAAIGAGAHYIDTTGEQPFLQAVQVHDRWAKNQGVAVIPRARSSCSRAGGAPRACCRRRWRSTRGGFWRDWRRRGLHTSCCHCPSAPAGET